MTNTPPTNRYDRIKAEVKQTSVTLRGAALLPATDAREDGWPETDFVPRSLSDPSPLSALSEFLRTLQSNRLPPNIQAIIATLGHVSLHDVAQLAYKTVEVMPPPCVAHLSSSGDDISILTFHIDQLVQQVAALSTCIAPLRSPSLPLRLWGMFTIRSHRLVPQPF
jgi:hypothetical protein